MGFAELADRVASVGMQKLTDATMTVTPAGGGAAVAGPVLYDRESVDTVGIVSGAHVVTFQASAFAAVKEGDTAVIGAASFRVAEVRLQADGRIASALLHKVAG